MVRIRTLADSDLPALRELFLHARRATFTWLDGAAFRLQDFDAQTLGERVLVAETGNGAIAGFLALWEPDQFIHHLYIAADYQRQGIGRALLRAAGWPETRLTLKCLRRNEAALAFYTAHHFVDIGQGSDADSDYLLLASTPSASISR